MAQISLSACVFFNDIYIVAEVIQTYCTRWFKNEGIGVIALKLDLCDENNLQIN